MQQLAKDCAKAIRSAREAGLTIDKGNVVDLCADQITLASLADIRAACVILGEL